MYFSGFYFQTVFFFLVLGNSDLLIYKGLTGIEEKELIHYSISVLSREITQTLANAVILL